MTAYTIKQPLIIGMAGASGSGKTTVTEKIAQRIPDNEMLTIIRHDDYYRNQDDLTMEQRLATNYDHPFSLDNTMLFHDLQALKNNCAITKPIYDFVHHTRSKEVEQIQPTSIILLEGILSLEDERLRSLMDIKIFVDTPADICLIRRLQRDVLHRGRSLESVLEQYLTTVRSMHEQFIGPSKRYADIIIPTGGDNLVAIDLLITKIFSAHLDRNSV